MTEDQKYSKDSKNRKNRETDKPGQPKAGQTSSSRAQYRKSGDRGPSRRKSGRTAKREYASIRTRAASREAIKKDLGDGRFIVFDIETTGGNPERNGITEICALRYEGGEIVDRMCTLVNPKVPIPPIVRRMTGINDRMVRNAPTIDKVMPDFIKFIGNDILVSHNTIGDLKFIRYFAQSECQHTVDNFFLCTHLLADKLASEAPDKSLSGLGKYFELDSEDELHRAEADAELTLRLLDVLMQRLRKQKMWTIEEGIRFQGDYESGYRIGWAVPEDVIQQIPSSPGVICLRDNARRILFVSSAMNGLREVRKLKRFDQLPRPIFRKIVRAVELEYIVTDSRYHALNEEAEWRAKHHIDLDPFIWHQRSICTINLIRDETSVRLKIGHPCKGAIGMFGPVRDRKKAQALVDSFEQKCGLTSDKKGVVIPEEMVEPLAYSLSGMFKHWQERQQKAGKSIFKKLRGMIGRKKKPVLDVGNIESLHWPQAWKPLINISGVAEINHEKRHDLHVIDSGKIVRTTKATPGWMDTTLNGRFWKDYLAKAVRHDAMPLRTQPLKLQDSYLLNGLLWWIYSASNRSEGVFHSVRELTNNH